MKINQFLRRVNAIGERSGDGCWEWDGPKHNNGYGQVYVELEKWYAHRRVFSLLHGPIPKGTEVCHRCDNRICINPDHLFGGTHLENVRDCVAKGRHRNPHIEKRKAATHCMRGHPFEGDNLLVDAKGHRRCYTCNLMLGRRYDAKRRGRKRAA